MSDMEVDWLNEGAQEARQEAKQLEIEFARNYEIFTNDPRGRAILEHWNKTMLMKATPAEAPIQAYAYDEAVRNFIRKIHRQIEIAAAGRE